jgi:predicted neutral ceramidase superfamily lipid hydrolase
MGDRLRDEANRLLAAHTPDPVDENLAAEIDRIVDAARRHLG